MSTPQTKQEKKPWSEETKRRAAEKRAATIAAKKAAAADDAASISASTASSEPTSVRSQASSRSWKELNDDERAAFYKARAAKAAVTKAINRAAEAEAEASEAIAEAQRLMALAEEKKAVAERLKADAEAHRAKAEAAAEAAAELLARNATPPRSPSPSSEVDEASPKKRTITPEQQAKMQAGRDIAGFRRIVESMLEKVEDPAIATAALLASGGNPFDLFS